MKTLIRYLAPFLMAASLFAQSTPTVQVDTWAALKAITIPPVPGKLTALVKGRLSTNDGGGGIFFFTPGAGATDDGGTIATPNSGTGAWFRQYSGPLNLLWFGANTNGVVDALSALTAAISVAQTSSFLIFIPQGTYKLSGVTDLPGGMTIAGAGNQATILQPVDGVGVFTVTGDKKGVTIKDLQINYGPATGTIPSSNVGSVALKLIASGGFFPTYFTLQDCWILYGYQGLVDTTLAYMVDIRRCLFYFNRQDGILKHPSTGTTTWGLDHVYVNQSTNGISIWNVNSLSISSSVIERTSAQGLLLTSCHTSIDGLDFEICTNSVTTGVLAVSGGTAVINGLEMFGNLLIGAESYLNKFSDSAQVTLNGAHIQLNNYSGVGNYYSVVSANNNTVLQQGGNFIDAPIGVGGSSSAIPTFFGPISTTDILVQSAQNLVLASPTSGTGPLTVRALVVGDLPAGSGAPASTLVGPLTPPFIPVATSTTNLGNSHLEQGGTFIVPDGDNTITAGSTTNRFANVNTVLVNGVVPATGTVTGTGTANTLSKWTSSTAQGNSKVTDDGTTVTVTGSDNVLLSGGTLTLMNTNASAGSLIIKSETGTDTAVQNESYSSTVSAGFVGKRAAGTIASPTAAQSGYLITKLSARPYMTTTFAQTDRARFGLYDKENATDTATGTYATIETTPNGATNIAERIRVTDTTIQPGTDASIGSGTAPLRWNGVTSTIYTANAGSISSDTPNVFSQQWNSGGTTFHAAKIVATNTASAAASELLQFLGGTAGTTEVASVRVDGQGTFGGLVTTTLNASGVIQTSSGGIQAPATGYFVFGSTRSAIQSPSDGILEFSNNAVNDFTRLQFGGTTASFPAIGRNGPVIQFQDATGAASGGWFQWGGQARISTQYDQTTTTLGNVTGLTVSLQAGRTYNFYGHVDATLDSTGGGKYAVGGTATATAINYRVRHDAASLARVSSTRQTSLGSSVAATSTLTDDDVEIEGQITVNAAGTLTIQFAQSVANGTSSILTGGFLRVFDCP